MNTVDITVSRNIPASAEAAFDAWLDPSCPASIWFGAEKSIVNAHVDGLYFWLVKHADRLWAHYGRFLRLDRPTPGKAGAAEFTWMSEGTHGLDTTVSLKFEPHGEETHVTLKHSGVPDDAMGQGHREGWTHFLDNLAEKISAPQNQPA